MNECKQEETGDWYCHNCGYLSGTRVTYSETCDTCHTPVEWHDAETLDAVAALQLQLSQLQAENEWLRKGLLEAADEIEIWGAHADAYIQEKHDLAGWVAKFKALAAEEGE
jgi:hypothetical protein